MDTLRPTELANAITGFATVFAGLTTLGLSLLKGPHPLRWMLVYAAIFVTGVPTVWYHGTGETFWPGLADIGTNLLLGWLLVAAALGDFAKPRLRWGVAAGMGLLNLLAILFRLLVGRSGAANPLVLSLGSFGGFTLGELMLIANSLLAVILLYLKLGLLCPPARSLLFAMTGVFLLGALLASAGNHVVEYRFLAFHALWHLVGAFGFVFLWAFNDSRFSPLHHRDAS